MPLKEYEIYTIEDTPNWVRENKVADIKSNHDSPYNFPLVDYQDCIYDDEMFFYRGTYECINDESRIEDASLNLIELHQGSQRLVIHELSIVRKGKKINALDVENISAIQRETSLENHITDNRITVSIIIDDLRVGDHVVFRTTLIESKSDHPFHGQHFSSNYSLSWACPVALQIVRVINNSSVNLRVLQSLLIGSSSQSETEIIEPNSEFERKYTDLLNERIPDAVPDFVTGSFLQISSMLKWSELSRYLFGYFESNGALSSIPVSVVGDLGISSPEDSLQDQALKVIRFVQNNIRYRGENHGVFTHTPKQPEITLKKRAGDCKDKSNLMVSLLALIGIKAKLVLVNTNNGKKIAEFNPSPYHFNHMIVDVEFNDKHYFVDATIQKQAGNFEHFAELNYGVGLPLTSQGSGLVDILKSPSNKVFELTHRFMLPHNSAEATLEIERVYYRHRANNMRSYFASNEKSKYQQDFLEWAKSDTGLNLELIEPIIVVEDDHDTNTLKAKESYAIVDIAKSHPDKKIELLTEFIGDFLSPNSDQFPIRINLDGQVQHDIFVTYDRRPTLQKSQKKINIDAFKYLDLVEDIKGNQIHYLTRITPLKGHVDGGEEAKLYKKKVADMLSRCNNLIEYNNKSAFFTVINNDFFWFVFFIVIFTLIKVMFL